MATSRSEEKMESIGYESNASIMYMYMPKCKRKET